MNRGSVFLGGVVGWFSLVVAVGCGDSIECALCGDQCVDLSSDPKNCGACAHDCQGGACSAGVCQPLVLASEQHGPQAIVVDAENAYWTVVDGPVKVCAIGGCNGAPRTLPSAEGAPIGPRRGIAVDAMSVYWTEAFDGTVMKCAIGGCNGAPTTLASGLAGPPPPSNLPSDDYPQAIAVDANDVYWTNYGGGTVMKCAIGGCDNAPTTLATETRPLAIAVDAENVYWTAYDGTVLKCATGGCNNAPTTLASGLDHPQGIAVDAESVYWTDNDAGTVMKCATGGCNDAPTTLASGLDYPDAIAVDAESVYWTSYVSGTVLKCAIAGCNDAPTTLASGQDPEGIVVDATSVYWTNRDGTVMKVAKE